MAAALPRDGSPTAGLAVPGRAAAPAVSDPAVSDPAVSDPAVSEPASGAASDGRRGSHDPGFRDDLEHDHPDRGHQRPPHRCSLRMAEDHGARRPGPRGRLRPVDAHLRPGIPGLPVGCGSVRPGLLRRTHAPVLDRFDRACQAAAQGHGPVSHHHGRPGGRARACRDSESSGSGLIWDPVPIIRA
ncbi:hypothetical protein FEZ32_01105 [Acidipropionibacterium jensenii]|nr:hypothetical protein FEZ32_01105 [Acidipropionibacterium jensenii]